MSSGPVTGGGNFQDYLPKVSAGDKITYDDINKLSKATMRNSLSGGFGGVVKRTSTGTSIIAQDTSEDFVPWTVSVSVDEDGLKRVMMAMCQSNVWSGQGNTTRSAGQDFDYNQSSGSLDLPVGEFTLDDTFSTSAQPVVIPSFPYYMHWKWLGGSRLVWIEVNENEKFPILQYTDLETYAKYAERAQGTPIAYIDSDGNVLQINKGAIFIDPTGLRFKRHPFQVTLKRVEGTSSETKVYVETGSVISYPQAFVDIMADGDDGFDVSSPFAIKRGESMGGGWHLNDGKTWGMQDGEFVYLKFERGVIAGNYTASSGDSTQWKCTINIGELSASQYSGNYNTQVYGACADTMPTCGPATVVTVPVNIGELSIASITVSYQKRYVNISSSGTFYYPIAKMGSNALDGYPEIKQFIKSDFYFYPPLDARMSFTETTLGSLTTGLPPSGGE